MRILFVADNHYDARPGYHLYQSIKDDYDINFVEDDWSCFTPGLKSSYNLLILNMIADTCSIAPPTDEQTEHVRSYVEAGGNILLVHGGSAAFWPHAWWRELVGWRWVRGKDPDGVAKSTHPVRPYTIDVAKSRHPLTKELEGQSLPEDEIYINLEQTCPTTTLLETTIDEGSFVQAWHNSTPYGGEILGFLPGHSSVVTQHPWTVSSIKTFVDYLTK